MVLVLVEGAGSLRIDVGLKRFLLIGLMMSGFFVIFTIGIRFSNPISAAAVAGGGPVVAAVTVRLVPACASIRGSAVALALTLVWWWPYSRPAACSAGARSRSARARSWSCSPTPCGPSTAQGAGLVRTGQPAAPRLVASLSRWGGWFRSRLALGSSAGRGRRFAVARRLEGTQLLLIACSPARWAPISGTSAPAGSVSQLRRSGSIWCVFRRIVSMAYGFMPNVYQIVGGLVALSGVVYMQWRKLQTMKR